ncbi:MAG: ribbon-helix-helix domain-containing protein [Spirochaetota bacterium]
MVKKVMISLPDQFLSEIDDAAKSEHRTRSDFIREALREYLNKIKEYKRPIDNPRVRKAYEGLRSIRWKEKFDSTEIIREMRESRYSK